MRSRGLRTMGNRLYLIALALCVVVLSITNGGNAYAAETGGYPWADADEISLTTYDWGYSECQPAMRTAQTCSAHYTQKSGVTYWQSDPWRYDVRNCTSFVAWKIHQSYGRALSGWGDARNWDEAARRAGYAVDGAPRVGDVAVWNGGKYGHVAFVVAVNADGSVNVEQYNKAGKGEFSRQSRLTADTYIHTAPAPLVTIAPQPTVADLIMQATESRLATLPAPAVVVPVVLPPPTAEQSSASTVNVPTSEADDTAYFVGTSKRDRVKTYAIKHKNTSSGHVEIAQSDDQSDQPWQPHRQTPEPVKSGGQTSYTLADYNADGALDMYAISHQATATGKVEVAVLDGQTDFAAYLGRWTTSEPEHGVNQVWYGVADQNGDGQLDLYQIWHDKTVNEHVQVTVLDGARGFGETLQDVMIPEPQRAAMDAYYMLGDNNGDGKIDLFQVLHNNTKSGKAEVKIFDGLADFAQVISKWVTNVPSYQGKGPLMADPPEQKTQ